MGQGGLPPRTRRPAAGPAPRVRRGSIRIAGDVAWRVRAGHPWVFREALGGRPLREPPGTQVDVLDTTGAFVASGIYDPDGPIAVRVFTRDPATQLDRVTIRQRVDRARRLRERLVPRSLTAYRAVHGEGDGLPGVTVDKYGDFLVVHLYTAALEPHAEALREALGSVWQPRGIYEQHRYRPQTGEGVRGPAQLAAGEAAPVEIEVEEEGLKFAVDVTAPLGTGLFLDLREGRKAVARHAPGRRVLNLFSYTGAFSLYAAKAGAKEVVSVDLASRAHARARHNLGLNGLGEAGQEFIAGDAVKVVARMAERGRKFDLVIVDPPSFAQAKGSVFVAQKDYRDLVSAVLEVTEAGGILACASNTAKLALDDFDRILGDGATRVRRTLSVIERRGLPVDFPVPAGFPEGHYLKMEICVAG
jgi:23S rRNA (cytosine1962-C5)-methyltransferase